MPGVQTISGISEARPAASDGLLSPGRPGGDARKVVSGGTGRGDVTGGTVLAAVDSVAVTGAGIGGLLLESYRRGCSPSALRAFLPDISAPCRSDVATMIAQ